MTQRYGTTMMAALLSVVLLTGAAAAHPGHDHKIMGTVTMAAADHVMVKSPDGKEVTATINKATKFMRAKKAMKAADLKVGMRVVITAVTDEADDKSIATVIELGPDVVTKQ